MDAEAILDVDDHGIRQLASGFFNDAFIMDQNACSSPHLILWRGCTDIVEAAMQRFWAALIALLHNKYDLSPIHAIDKYVQLCRTAINLAYVGSFTRHDNLVYRARLETLPRNIEDYRGQYGFFYEYVIEDFSCLKEIVSARYQTLTCFGVDREALVAFIINEGLIGVDRVVPVGKALDIGVIWDGHDLIAELSRIVYTA